MNNKNNNQKSCPRSIPRTLIMTLDPHWNYSKKIISSKNQGILWQWEFSLLKYYRKLSLHPKSTSEGWLSLLGYSDPSCIFQSRMWSVIKAQLYEKKLVKIEQIQHAYCLFWARGHHVCCFWTISCFLYAGSKKGCCNVNIKPGHKNQDKTKSSHF